MSRNAGSEVSTVPALQLRKEAGHGSWPGISTGNRIEKDRLLGSGPSGNRTRVLGSEAQEDILYPMDPPFHWYHKILSIFRGTTLWNDTILAGN